MKKFTKLIFSCAAVAALSAAIGTAALAAPGDVTGTITGDITGTYDVATKTITITDYESTGEQATMLVLNKDATQVADADIEAIDQAAKIESIPLGIENPAAGTKDTYYIRIGGSNGEIRMATLTISTEGDTPTPGNKVLIGNVDQAEDDVTAEGAANVEAITTNDASWVIQSTVDTRTLEGESVKAADTNGTVDQGKVTPSDAANILSYLLNGTGGSVGTLVDAD